ncbi:hypothetical protein HU200_008865 [Digitaria exilis]|uniref:Uncharacterized protein n=1 Tax=Digitaria exilis TaxID=1010633 RepID=A0A835KNL9_9POAL|nr:hypothetical protein HU200_008865 [Digitaria exilis]
MNFAMGPLSTLLLKLAKLLQDEYELHKGTRKCIQFLYKELETMHAALGKLDEVPRDQLDDLQRIWSRDVRELSYDMEDIVDTFMVDVEGPDPPSKGVAKKIFNKMIRKVNKPMARREVAQEINDIKERAKELAQRRDRYKVDDIAPAKKISVDPRLKALYTEATEIVGIEGPKKEVIMMLTEGDGGQKKRIVSIAGFGGLGKTTLAKAVYDQIQGQFNCTAFVSVSRIPDTKKILKDMLYQLDKTRFENIHSKVLDERFLMDKAIEFLKDKRYVLPSHLVYVYLIVIDDIWDKEPWDKVIGLSLIENNMRSRIITTTRNIDVAEHVGGCYRLKPLSDKSSETLFYGRIFGSKDTCPARFLDVSEKILKKCGGVPLAVVTTSSLLANKSEKIKEWYNVCDSIGSGLGKNNPGMDDMREILLLSYYDLPSHLKACLLYLSIFPEDYEIRKDMLIWRWVAEGFVQKVHQAAGGQISFLEIGESYFDELLNRSLIQPAGKVDMEGIHQACRVHDTVLDLIIQLSIEESFITTVLGDGMESKVRWLSLHNYTTWPTMKMPKLRSLTIFKLDVVIDPTPYLPRYCLLRVLDLQGCRLKNLVSLGFLGNLSHLRYLGLSSSAARYARIHANPDLLPVEIGKLRFLQTLDLSETRVDELPSSVITGLEQLMCLRGAPVWGTMLPDGLKNLTCLEVLEMTTITSERIAEELGHLTKLRILEVGILLSTTEDDEWRACAKALVESVGKMAKIESLDIHVLCKANLEGPIEEPLGNMRRLYIDRATMVPTWIQPELLPTLSCLDLEVKYERREDIHVLGTLPCLRHLRFKVYLAGIWQEAFRDWEAFKTFEHEATVHANHPRIEPMAYPSGV